MDTSPNISNFYPRIVLNYFLIWMIVIKPMLNFKKNTSDVSISSCILVTTVQIHNNYILFNNQLENNILASDPSADHIFEYIFLNKKWIWSKISLKFVPKGLIINIPALVQTMAWCCPGDKPLSEPMVVRLPMHICVTRPQWVKVYMLLECSTSYIVSISQMDCIFSIASHILCRFKINPIYDWYGMKLIGYNTMMNTEMLDLCFGHTKTSHNICTVSYSVVFGFVMDMQCQKLGKIFTGLTYKLFSSFTGFFSDVYRSFIWNKTTFTKYCLTQWISKLPGSFEIHWVRRQCLVNFMGLAGIVNATVYKTKPIFRGPGHCKLS